MLKKLLFKFPVPIMILIALTFWYGTFLVSSNVNGFKLELDVFMALVHVLFGLVIGILIKRLHVGNYSDVLTNLGNRRYFFEKLTEEIARSDRTGLPVSLLILDIDNFKGINDNFGHVKGDAVLKQISLVLKEHSRISDSLARWGGEEFAIILPSTDAEGAGVVAERVRQAVEESNFFSRITISIGVATTKGTIELDKFVSVADSALYKAKEVKNSVVVYRVSGGEILFAS